ncbi:MAG: GIY-YIG nuclease family protein [Patescibacteria group bacterium]
MHCCYILKSFTDNSYYVGSTNNLTNRLNFYNRGKSRYTKRKIPWVLIYSECFSTLSLARKREYQLKSWKNRDSLERLIKKSGSIV